MRDEDEFERKILGIWVGENERLKELQSKIMNKGLRGDEVYEFIHLDRYELVKQLAERDEKIKELRTKIPYYCPGISGSQPINEACGGCEGCIEAQTMHSIYCQQKKNVKLKVENEKLREGVELAKELIGLTLSVEDYWKWEKYLAKIEESDV